MTPKQFYSTKVEILKNLKQSLLQCLDHADSLVETEYRHGDEAYAKEFYEGTIFGDLNSLIDVVDNEIGAVKALVDMSNA